MVKKTLEISFNPLLRSIPYQLGKQGYKFDQEVAHEFEQSKMAIFELSIADLITDKQEQQIKRKLFKQIKQHVVEQNKDLAKSIK